MLSGKTKGSSANSSPSRHPMSMCGDCGANAPSWASVNRGILLCSECCSVHRSIGRHISQVKCLRGGAQWISEQLVMVQSLYSCGANSIWEYSLLNPASGSMSTSSSKVTRSSSLTNSSSGLGRDSHGANISKLKKPKPSDPLHPIKSDFIRAKHLSLAFVYKPAKDEPLVTEVELSRQLHSSVRTPNLETSLRLLSQGADPNFYHPEKNSSPLQVAARAGQACQVELLLVYGADPGALDKTGKTAADSAKASGQSGIATRLINAQYELSDRLSYFLCQKKPDHSSGQHFLIPESIPGAQDRPEESKVAKRRLQGCNNAVFEELAMDVYDEVDRRETDTIWASLEGNTNKSVINMPFLPVNPDYGTTRNQARQKLGRLESREFNTLVLDVLKEIRRRQTDFVSMKASSPLREAGSSFLRDATRMGLTKSMPMPRTTSGMSDDEPIYDHVASDDDYYHIPDTPDERKLKDVSNALAKKLPNSNCSSPSKSSSSGGIKKKPDNLQSSEFEQIKAQLENSEQKVQALIDSNDDMRSEITRLATIVNKLVNENLHLRGGLTNEASPTHSAIGNNAAGSRHSGSNSSLAGPTQNQSIPADLYARASPVPKNPPPPPPLRTTTAAIYDQPTTRSPSRQQLYGNNGPASLPGTYGTVRPMFQSRTPSSMTSSGGFGHYPLYHSESFDEYDIRTSGSASLPPYSHEYAVVGGGGGGGSTGMASILSSPTYVDLLPSQEEVVRRTEAITRCIQELLISAKDEKFESFIPCSERIVRAVTDMVSLFPSASDPAMAEDFPGVANSLTSLTAAANRFEIECRNLILKSQKEPLNQGFVTQQVIQCAFDIAKSTKQLVALFQ